MEENVRNLDALIEENKRLRVIIELLIDLITVFGLGETAIENTEENKDSWS